MADVDGISHTKETALSGWQQEDPFVVIQPVANVDEGGPGVHGFYEVASRVYDNFDGTWEYSYAVINQNSTQGAQRFRIPAGPGSTLTNTWFNDVDYHSGELQDGTDWNMTQTANAITFTCPESYATNPDANALNWGTTYSFGFTSNTPPVDGVGELEMFEPGVGNTLTFPLEGPTTIATNNGTPYCMPGATCACGQGGGVDTGCANSAGSGAAMVSHGTATFSTDTLSFTITGVPGQKPGLILRGDNQIFQGVSAGVICTTGSSMRSHVQVSVGGSTSFTDFAGAPFGSVANPPGVVTNFQYWYRDPAFACGTGFNFSNAYAVYYYN